MLAAIILRFSGSDTSSAAGFFLGAGVSGFSPSPVDSFAIPEA
jgi:hypothetical protein